MESKVVSQCGGAGACAIQPVAVALRSLCNHSRSLPLIMVPLSLVLDSGQRTFTFSLHLLQSVRDMSDTDMHDASSAQGDVAPEPKPEKIRIKMV